MASGPDVAVKWSLKVRKWECLVWVQDCKVALFMQKRRKGKRTTTANCIDLFPSGYSRSECRRKKMWSASLRQPPPLRVNFKRRSGVDSFPARGGAQHNSENACVHVVIDWHGWRPVNYTISAQMPLGKEQLALAINYRQRWPDLPRPWLSLFVKSGVIRSQTSANQSHLCV